jgi:hypothetical protein
MRASMKSTVCKLMAVCAIAALHPRYARGQSQTNVNVYDKTQADPAGENVPVTPTGPTVVKPGAVTPSGDTVISKGAYTPPDTATTVGAIPPDETKVLQRRREAKRFSTAGFGPAGFGNVDEKVPAYDVYAGKIWEVNRVAAIKALGEVASDFDRASIVDLNLGANLYAMPTDFSPYVGGAMGLTYGSVPGDRALGMNVGASVGALLFRTSNAQMNIEGNAQMMLTELNNERPSIYSARLGVLF